MCQYGTDTELVAKDSAVDRKYAKEIARMLSSVEKANEPKYKLEKTLKTKSLSGFRPSADGLQHEGAFLFKDKAGNGLWVLLIDWRAQDSFYVVLFPESKSGPIAEIHKIINKKPNEVTLYWRYSPTKRDGRNEERKAYFVEAFISCEVQISVPSDTSDIDEFIDELFLLANSRVKADGLNPDRPTSRNGFPEGKLKEKLHLSRERNSELVRKAKNVALKRDGFLKCACCNFDFFATYGEVGKGFIEAHHTKPLSSLHEDGEETIIDDLVLVCSNCHRMLHRRRPWLEMDELSKLLPVINPVPK